MGRKGWRGNRLRPFPPVPPLSVPPGLPPPPPPAAPALMRILFAGIIGRYPFGGVTWCSLMYLLGLRALGHEVFYVEDTGECVYDPILNTVATDPAYGTQSIHAALAPV